MTERRLRHRLTAFAAAALATLAVQAQDSTPAPAAALPSASQPAIRVSVDPGELLADGRSRVHFHVVLGNAHRDGLSAVQVTTTGGRLLDTTGAAADAAVLNLPVKNGRADFILVAPSTPGPVRLRVEGGGATAEGRLEFLPELRDMIATGVIEGVISQRRLRAGSIRPVDFADSPEQEIRRWSRQFGGDTSAAARVAFFLKGHIGGDALLTAAYDSDKDTRQKLAKTVDPNAVYPVYGDESVTGFEARSGDRLFVRIDRERSFLLYGDFSTAGTSTPIAPALADPTTAADKVRLARYQRTATGLQLHHDTGTLNADAFVIDDSLRQVVEEYPANGTSGPFAVRNGNALQDSERVEVVVRDRNQRGVIRSVTPLIRFVDYTFEPFSGRVLLSSPLPSLTPTGDPVSLKITYEVDQGGERFLVFGASADAAVMPGVRVGGSFVTDHDPLAPFRLRSAHADIAVSKAWNLLLETAQTESTLYTANGQVYAVPTHQAGEVANTATGRADRVDLSFKDRGAALRLWWLRADAGFNNPSSGLVPGRQDMGLRASQQVSRDTRFYAEHTRTDDQLAQVGRHATRLGVAHRLTDALEFDLSFGRLHDNAGFPVETLIGPQPTTGGGFFGTGTSNTVMDPLTGAPIATLAPVGSTPAPAADHPLDASTVRLAATWKAATETVVLGEAEGSVAGESRHRASLGITRTINDTERLYARLESQTGLASANSLAAADRSTSFVAGLTHAVSAGTQVFSEYRLVDATSSTAPANVDRLLAAGLRRTQSLSQGLSATTTLERLKVLSGAQRDAVAIGSALDYGADPAWKGSAKLEYRQLSDDAAAPGDQRQDQWLATLALARRLDADWTLLLKNYWLLQRNRDDAAGQPLGPSRQERFLGGVAWRPRATNLVNALGRYEYKSIDDNAQPLGEHYAAHIVSAVMDYRPERSVWMSGRLAAKRRTDTLPDSGPQAFSAYLAAGRVTWEFQDRFDAGVLASRLAQTHGVARQSAYGAEAGYSVKKNVWVSIGYNWTGFVDRDLAGSDYTQRGAFLRLRAKFDEESFAR